MPGAGKRRENFLDDEKKRILWQKEVVSHRLMNEQEIASLFPVMREREQTGNAVSGKIAE